jgi:anti-sigma regulatory factor (Ser/Thr protein kinase)
MNAMAPPRPTELHGCQVRLTAAPAAPGEARRQVRAAIRAWDVPVDEDVAVLLASELVTNAVTHQAGRAVTLVLTCSPGRLRVDVHDPSRSLPVLASASSDDETGRGLMLVDTLADEWGSYRTPAGKAVYFTLAFEPGLAGSGGPGPRGVQAWGL